MSRLTVVYDACVLYPAPLRDLLMHLAMTDLYRAKWTDAIHDEWTRNVLRQRPDLTPEQLRRTRQLMDAHVRDCLVTGYEALISGLTLPDPQDRHVLAAAIRAGADLIVTVNLRHFPSAALRSHGIQAQHPDDFVCHLLDLGPDLVCAAVHRHRASLRHPPKAVDDYLRTLESQGLPRAVAGLRGYAAGL